MMDPFHPTTASIMNCISCKLRWVDEPQGSPRRLRRPSFSSSTVVSFCPTEKQSQCNLIRSKWTMSCRIWNKILTVHVLDITSSFQISWRGLLLRHVRLSCVNDLVPSCQNSHRYVELATWRSFTNFSQMIWLWEMAFQKTIMNRK